MGGADSVISDHDRRAYLLGTADLKTTHMIELELLRGGEELERIEQLEDELIDDYVFGRLPDEENLRFWDHFLCTPSRESKLGIANELRLWASARIENTRQFLPWGSLNSQSTWRIAAGIAACTLIVLSIWLGVSNAKLRLQLAIARQVDGELSHVAHVAQSAPPAGQLSNIQQPAVPEPDHLSTRIAEVTLAPGLTRSIQVSQLVKIHSGDAVVLLTLESLTQPRSSEWSYKLFNADGQNIWSQVLPDRGHAAQKKFGQIAVPAAILNSGDFKLRVAFRNADGDFEDLDSYSFRVLKD